MLIEQQTLPQTLQLCLALLFGVPALALRALLMQTLFTDAGSGDTGDEARSPASVRTSGSREGAETASGGVRGDVGGAGPSSAVASSSTSPAPPWPIKVRPLKVCSDGPYASGSP